MAVPKIESYRFGEIVIDGRRYSSDVIIYPDRVEGQWWREEGHSLASTDVWQVLQAPPEVLVIGQGGQDGCKYPPRRDTSCRRRGYTSLQSQQSARAKHTIGCAGSNEWWRRCI